MQTNVTDKCIIERLQLSDDKVQALIRTFARNELCPCSFEAFQTYDGDNVKQTKDALFRSVMNEMILRVLAEWMQ